MPYLGPSSAATQTGRRSTTGRVCFPKTSTRATPGSSGTSWCGKTVIRTAKADRDRAVFSWQRVPDRLRVRDDSGYSQPFLRKYQNGTMAVDDHQRDRMG